MPKHISSKREKSLFFPNNNILYFCLKNYSYSILISVVEMALTHCFKSDLQEADIPWPTILVVDNDYGTED